MAGLKGNEITPSDADLALADFESVYPENTIPRETMETINRCENDLCEENIVELKEALIATINTAWEIAYAAATAENEEEREALRAAADGAWTISEIAICAISELSVML